MALDGFNPNQNGLWNSEYILAISEEITAL